MLIVSTCFSISGNSNQWEFFFQPAGTSPPRYTELFCKRLQEDTIDETKTHLCHTGPAFDDIQKSLDLASSDQDMVAFFGMVIERLMKLELLLKIYMNGFNRNKSLISRIDKYSV